MAKSKIFTVLTSAAMIALTACGSQPVDRNEINTAPHFWQRANASSAIYQRGPKAQQMLNRDISRCLIEIRELERLGSIRRATPADTNPEGDPPPDPETAEGAMAKWETPERNGMLYAEHLDYHDFETCMIDKGWERVEHVPYDVAHEAREVYVETIMGQKYRTKRDMTPSIIDPEDKEFENLND